MERNNSIKTFVVVIVAVLLIIGFIIAFFLLNTKKEDEKAIVLPDTAPATEVETKEPEKEEEIGLLTVTRENIQSIIESMDRSTSYHQVFSLTVASGDSEGTRTADVWVSGDCIRTEVKSEKDVRVFLRCGDTAYVWYDGDTEAVKLSVPDTFSNDDVAGIPTYEDVLNLPYSKILDAGFDAAENDEQNFIFVSAIGSDGIEEYKISLDTGLLFSFERTGETDGYFRAVQSSCETYTDSDEALSEVFLLPDGTNPFFEQ